jgi:hypothetical protein
MRFIIETLFRIEAYDNLIKETSKLKFLNAKVKLVNKTLNYVQGVYGV